MIDLYVEDLSCSFCKGTDIRADYRQGNMKCINCGLIVFEGIIDSRPVYDEQIGYSSAPMNNLEISNNNSKRSSQKILTTKTIENYDGSVVSAMKEIKNYASRMGLSSKVVNTAEIQFEKLRESFKSFKGYNMQRVAVAVLYVAVNLCNLPFSLKRICEETGTDSNEIGSIYLKIQPHCDVPDKTNLGFSESKEAKALQLHCKHLSIARDTVKQAEEILEKIINGYWLNGNPNTKIAVAIHAALTQETTSSGITVEMISKEVGPAAKTIKENYKKIAGLLIFQ